MQWIGIADLLAKDNSSLPCNSCCHRNSCNPSWLGAGHLASLGQHGVQHILRQLRCLATSRLSDQHKGLVRLHSRVSLTAY